MFVNMQAAQGTSFYEMVEVRRSRSPTSSSQNPYVDAFMASAGGGGGGRRRRTTAACMVQLMPRATARRCRRSRSRSSCGRSSLRFPGFRGFVEPAAVAADRRPHGQPELQPHGAEPRTPTSCTRGRRSSSAAIARRCPRCRTSRPTCEIKSPRVNLVIDRDKAAAVGLNATQIAERAVRRASARNGRRRSTAPRPVPRAARARSEVPAAGRLAGEDRVQDAARARWCRSSRSSTFKEDGRPADRSTTPASCRRCRSRSACSPGVSLGDGDRRTSSRWPTSMLPADHHDQLRGLGQGVPGVDEQPGPAAVRRDRRRLHRARRALRELHPPDHDSLRAAVGRPRRAASRCGCSATS